MDERELQRTLKRIADTLDESTSLAVAVAAIVACLPDSANVDLKRVNATCTRMITPGLGSASLSSKAQMKATAILSMRAPAAKPEAPGA